MSLVSSLDSVYVKNSQKFSTAPQKEPILIYVEDEQDCIFWSKVFSFTFLGQTHKIEFSTYHVKETGKEITGKDKLVELKEQLGPNLMICIDADFDVLLPNNKYHLILQEKYIIHTVYYAIENILAHPSRLKLLVERGRSKVSQTDYQEMLKDLSVSIWPVFTFLLYTTSQFNGGVDSKPYSLKNFNSSLNLLKIQPNNYSNKTKKFKVSEDIQNQIESNREEIRTIIASLEAMSYRAVDTYKLMNGHTLFNIFLLEFLRSDMMNCSVKRTGKPSSEHVKEIFYSCDELAKSHIPVGLFEQIQEAFN